jgi:hypothetical protein
MLAVVLSIISAVAISLVTEVTTEAISKGYHKITSIVENRRSLGYDVRQDELYCLGDWSPARKLEPRRLITDIAFGQTRDGLCGSLLDRESHDGLHKYPGHNRCCAVDAHDGRTANEAISWPK